VFYEQYLTIVRNTVFNLVASLASIFVITICLLGFDVWTAAVIVWTIAMIIANMFCLMYFWSVSLNALSLVNLVMTVGISVEFCSHIARAFALSTKSTRVERARDAVINMGSSVSQSSLFTKMFKYMIRFLKTTYGRCQTFKAACVNIGHHWGLPLSAFDRSQIAGNTQRSRAIISIIIIIIIISRLIVEMTERISKYNTIE